MINFFCQKIMSSNNIHANFIAMSMVKLKLGLQDTKIYLCVFCICRDKTRGRGKKSSARERERERERERD